MPFVKHRLPCPACGGSDPVSVNDNGSGWCFSCGTYLPNYSTAEVQHNDVETEFEIRLRNSEMNNTERQDRQALLPLLQWTRVSRY